MAKKNVEDAQPKAVAEAGSQEESQKGQEQQAQKAKVTTTEGNTIDKIRVFQKDGNTMVQADYGKLNPEGKTSEERRSGMRTQLSRPLSPDQAKEYQKIFAEDPVKAKEFAVKSAYPMHVDDATFHQKTANINDHMNKDQRAKLVDSMSPEAKEKALSGKEGLVGKWQMAFGEKGNKDSRFYGILNKEELASIRHRAEVTLDEHGQVKSVGAPLTMAEIAGRMEQRVQAQRQTNGEKLEAAQKVDWSKFKLPSAANLTGLRYSAVKDNPDRVMLHGQVNGIEVSGLLSKNETTAVKNRVATLEQAAAANEQFRNKVLDILGSGEKKGVSEEAAVKAIIDRASDSSARAFTPEQVKTLNAFAKDAETPEQREQVFAGLWEKAQPKLAADGVNEHWQQDAREELSDLAQGAVRSEQQGMKR